MNQLVGMVAVLSAWEALQTAVRVLRVRSIRRHQQQFTLTAPCRICGVPAGPQGCAFCLDAMATLIRRQRGISVTEGQTAVSSRP